MKIRSLTYWGRWVNLTEAQKGIFGTDGYQLVTGGPGSGKPTVPILKAAKIAREALFPGQQILFLSFGRGTVSRVLEASDEESQVKRGEKKNRKRIGEEKRVEGR